ncbi:hypothetical protein Zmor_028486 [Zophobas morio]|uniref:NACHT domain-containing protein n=1 Tax=Zophobas morio TaxID=2755281 RepID=A0AA38M4C4_9CUCU|nr:hypothetical protein Zmor_028486 [Zophobas morio]
MNSESECDSQGEDERLKQLEEEIRRIKEKKTKRNSSKKQGAKTSITQQPRTICSSSEKCHKDRFRTYKKLPGTVDHGKEYEQMMCAFYALKLIARDDVEDFEMTTNNKEHGVFDDIGLTVTFKNTKKRTYLIQLKHKEGGKSITTNNLLNPKHDFGVQKYFNSLSSLNITDDVVCIVYTNSSTYIKESTEIAANIKLEVCNNIEYEDLLLNVERRNSLSIFQFLQRLEDKTQRFYFFTEQNNINNTKMVVEKMLHEMLQCNIYDSFMHFMSEWWSKSFVLSKDDVIAKLTELAVSPYMKNLSNGKQNTKTENLRKAIMNYSLTIVKSSEENVIENIWPDLNIPDEEFMKTKEKFGIKIREQDKIAWFLDKVPLIVKVDDSNKTTVQCVMKIMNKSVEKKQIILVGNVMKGEFDEMEVFEDLSDLGNKAGNEAYYRDILRNFQISLQGREPVCLEKFINIDREIAKHIGVGELLKMSQAHYIIGNEREELPELHIPRYVSTTFVKTEKIFTIYESQKNQAVVIINCDSTFKDLTLTHKKHNFVESSVYFSPEYVVKDNVIILSTESKLTHAEFLQVCEKSKKSNAYLFQVFDKESCALLLIKGNELPPDIIHESKNIPEADVLRYLDNPLNAVCAPPGMGKSTLIKVLYNNCPSHYWATYVDLINCNSFLKKKPDSTAMWNYFLRNTEGKEKIVEGQIKNTLLRNKKLYLFLDGLDEMESSCIDSVLNFAKKSNGINVWISSRENLRQKVSDTLNTVLVEIQQLSKEQQEEYMRKRLKEKYGEDKVVKILKAVFASVDLNNSQRLLGIPLQLHIIAEMFLNNDDAYKKIEDQDIFVLTQMYKLFFEGKIRSNYEKIAGREKTHMFGNINASLQQYEVIALKTCLETEDFKKLNVNLEELKDVISCFKEKLDVNGIIKKINESGEAVFEHQTYAEYFACAWLKKNKEKAALLKDVIFDRRYENLRLMFDVMLAENNPLHLSIVYKNLEQFDKYKHEINRADQGGRRPWELICSYGMKYPLSHILISDNYVNLGREYDWFVHMAKILVPEQNDVIKVSDNSVIFNFTWLNYCLEAQCLYPIELILERKLLMFSNIQEEVFKYYKEDTLAYYAAQMGYPNILSGVIEKNPSLVRIKLNKNQISGNLLATAVIGPKDKVNTPNNNFQFLDAYERTVQLLIKKGFDINAQVKDKMTALHLASQKGDCAITKILLNSGASINIADEDKRNALHYASESWKGNRNVIKLLIEKGIDVNVQDGNGKTALQLACKNGVYENAKMLLNSGASINIVDKDKMNALHYASKSWKDNRDVIKLLIEKGIDVNVQDGNGKTALQLACKNGVYENAKKLLSSGASINIVDKDKMNALHYASQSWKDNRDVIKLLIEKGIDVNVQDGNGKTALLFACRYGVYENAEVLLNSGASINMVDKDKMNALHYALRSRKHNPNVVKLLIEKGIDVNVQDGNGKTALLLAGENGVYETAEMLLNSGASLNIVDNDKMNALHYASQSWKDNRDVIKLMIEKGIDVNVQDGNGKTALQLACKNGDYGIAKKLLNSGASINNVDKDKMNALHYASESSKDNRDVIKLLIEKGIDVNVQNGNGKTALQLACKSGVYENAEVLLNSGASINMVDKDKMNALNYASQSWKDNRDVIKLMIEKGIDVNVQDGNGKTALQLACLNGDYEIAKKLLSSGASINIVDKDKMNALHYASESWKDNRDVIKLLIEKGIDVNVQDENGKTALQRACKSGVNENTEMLLHFGASINIVDKDERNALHYASESWKDNRDVIKLLIEKGIDVNVQDGNGKTALQLACKKGHYEIAKRLLSSGASINIVDKDKMNALYYASDSSKDNRDVMKLLIEKGIDLNAQNRNGTTALQLACLRSVYENTEMLLHFGASINIADKYKMNALHYASNSSTDNRDVMKLLIEKGIDLNAQNRNGTTALQLACLRGVYENAEMLLNSGASINIVNKDKMNALHYASDSSKDNRDVMKLLIEKGIDVNVQDENGKTALQRACKSGVYENTEMLLHFGASINIVDKDERNALHYASESWKDNRDVIKLLIEKGIDVNVQDGNGKTALQLACKKGHYEIAKRLLSSGASINIVDKDKMNALYYASDSSKDNRDVMKLLIEKGIDLNAQNRNGTTALQLACLRGVYENAEMLLNSGASINIVNKDERNALHYASESWKDNRDVMKLLIEKGTGVNVQDGNGKTALQLACLKGVYENAKMLLNSGASINIADKEENNALHYASRTLGINREVIKLLIEKGIDLNAQNGNGTAALQLACSRGVYENVEMLLDFGASIIIADKKNMNALKYASYFDKDNQDIIELLIRKGIEVNAQCKNGNTALHAACQQGVYKNAETLLDSGAWINIMDNQKDNELHNALDSRKNNRDIIALLIEKGVDVNSQNENGTTPLQRACRNGDYQNAKLLLEVGATINTTDNGNRNALHYASESLKVNRDTIKLLIEKGFHVDAQSQNGTTALQLACLKGIYENVVILLDFGASINIINKMGNNALHCAADSHNDNRDILNLLIENGINVNLRNQNGATALHLACRKGVYENAKKLLEFGAIINTTDKDDKNTLHYASESQKDNRKLIKLLTEHGIDIDSQNHCGATALQLACLQGVYKNVETLLDFGAVMKILDQNNKNALHYALCSRRDTRMIIKLLIDNGIDMHVQNKIKTTIFNTVARN